MNILPVQLKGKTVSDCYESDGILIIEFTDGSKVEIEFDCEDKEIFINTVV